MIRKRRKILQNEIIAGGETLTKTLRIKQFIFAVIICSYAALVGGCAGTGNDAGAAGNDGTGEGVANYGSDADLLVPGGDPENGGEIAIDVIAANDVGNLSQATVVLSDAAGVRIDERIADDMGGVVFAGVSAGTYTVSCEAEGFYGRQVSVDVSAKERSGRVVPLVPFVTGTEGYVLLEWRGEPQIDLDLCLFDAETGEYTDSAHSMDSAGNALYADRSFWDGYELMMIRDVGSSAVRSVYVLDWVVAANILDPQGSKEGEEIDTEAIAAELALNMQTSDEEETVPQSDETNDSDNTETNDAGSMQGSTVSMMEQLALDLYIYTADGEVCHISPDSGESAPLWRAAVVQSGTVTEAPLYISDLTDEVWTLLEPDGQIRREQAEIPEWKTVLRGVVTEELPGLCEEYRAEDYQSCVFYVLHIDEDDIPEIVIENPTMKTDNALILSYTGNRVSSYFYMADHSGWQFIPETGRVLFGALTDGRVDYDLMQLAGGTFSVIKSGFTSSYEKNGDQLTAYPEGQERCEWDGVAITGYISFEEELKKDFNMSETRDPDVLNEVDFTRLDAYLRSGE